MCIFGFTAIIYLSVQFNSAVIGFDNFGETEMNEYTVMDSEGIEWIGFRPMFKDITPFSVPILMEYLAVNCMESKQNHRGWGIS